MCHDINPLGTTMHLKELDRQAALSSCSFQQVGDARGTPMLILARVQKLLASQWRGGLAVRIAASATAAAGLAAVLGSGT